jgi:hypothetical protein
MPFARRVPFGLSLAALFVLAPPPAAAQVGRGDLGQEDVEIMPFGGYRTGGTLVDGDDEAADIDGGASYGGAIDINLHKGNFKLEAVYSHNDASVGLGSFFPGESVGVAIDYLQGGILQETGSERTRFYVSALLGATQFRVDGFDSVTKFSFSVGGGLKHFASPNFGLRLEARAFGTPTETNGGVACANGTCLFSFSGSILWQWDFTGGLVLAF